MLTILLIVLIVLALGGGGYGLRSGALEGPYAYGGIGTILVIILLVWLFSGGLPLYR